MTDRLRSFKQSMRYAHPHERLIECSYAPSIEIYYDFGIGSFDVIITEWKYVAEIASTFPGLGYFRQRGQYFIFDVAEREKATAEYIEFLSQTDKVH